MVLSTLLAQRENTQHPTVTCEVYSMFVLTDFIYAVQVTAGHSVKLTSFRVAVAGKAR